MIYRSIWKLLPGTFVVKIAQVLILAALAFTLLFTVVFPWIDLSFFAPPTVEG